MFVKNELIVRGVVRSRGYEGREIPLELVAEVPFDTRPGEDSVQWSVLPQARIGISKRGHVAVNVGVEVPLNERDRYDWRAYVYLIWDFADGGFFEAW